MDLNSIFPKYKTMLCRHFESPKGCIYKEKCQFAHGLNELRALSSAVASPTYPNSPLFHQEFPKTNNINYKVSMCKNFEKYGFCKFEDHCSFAHGVRELKERTVSKKHEFGVSVNNHHMVFSPEYYSNYRLTPQIIDYPQIYTIPVPMHPYMYNYYGNTIGSLVPENPEQIHYNFTNTLQERKK